MLRILSFVATVTNFVPFQELSSLSCLLADNPSANTVILIYQTAAKLVNFDQRYKHIFREVGLLDMLMNVLSHEYDQLQRNTNNNELDQSKASTLAVILDCISVLIEDRDENGKILRER